MLNRPQKEKTLVSEGADLMVLQTTLKSLKRTRDSKKEELDALNKEIEKVVDSIIKKGGKASVN